MGPITRAVLLDDNTHHLANTMGKLRTEVRTLTAHTEALANELRTTNRGNLLMRRTLIAVFILALLGGAWAVTMFGGVVCV